MQKAIVGMAYGMHEILDKEGTHQGDGRERDGGVGHVESGASIPLGSFVLAFPIVFRCCTRTGCLLLPGIPLPGICGTCRSFVCWRVGAASCCSLCGRPPHRR